jgi:hypothetical protein
MLASLLLLSLLLLFLLLLFLLLLHYHLRLDMVLIDLADMIFRKSIWAIG